MALTGEVEAAFRKQANICRELGSPFTGRLCDRLAEILDERTALGRTVIAWKLDPIASALALRVCGALHHSVRSGCAPGLAPFYPPSTGSGPEFDAALRQFIASAGSHLTLFLESAPQTNEVARSAILIGGLLTIAAETEKSLALIEIGASAGLNLHADRYAYDFGWAGRWGPQDAPLVIPCEWRGEAPPLDAPLKVVMRSGCDLAPIDANDPAGRERMIAYIWPDQPARLARTMAALDHAAISPVAVEGAEAADWAEERLSRDPRHEVAAGVARVLMHSITWQYFPEATQRRIADALARAGTRATRERPLAWLRLEPDGTPGSAAILLTLWPGGKTRLLGRGDYHGRYAEWSDP